VSRPLITVLIVVSFHTNLILFFSSLLLWVPFFVVWTVPTGAHVLGPDREGTPALGLMHRLGSAPTIAGNRQFFESFRRSALERNVDRPAFLLLDLCHRWFLAPPMQMFPNRPERHQRNSDILGSYTGSQLP